MLVRIAQHWSMYSDSVSKFLEYWHRMDTIDCHSMGIDETRRHLVVTLHQILKKENSHFNFNERDRSPPKSIQVK